MNSNSAIEVEKLDRKYGIVVESSSSRPMTEYDSETMQPMGEWQDIMVEISFKIEGEVKKTVLGIAHFIALFKEAGKAGVKVKRGKNYVHREETPEKDAPKLEKFDAIECAKEYVEREREADPMFM